MLSQFTAEYRIDIRSAMQKIDENKKGFLIVLNSDKVVGVLTDGDLRRALINGASMSCAITDICLKEFSYITLDTDFNTIIELFKDLRVKFLPIVNSEMELCNIITKSNLHALILQDIKYNPNYDFISMDDSLLEHEIYPRPWGYYKTNVLNQYCQCKTITVKPGGVLSLQKHLHREEHWIIVHGNGEVTIGDDVQFCRSGESYHIGIGVLHRVRNLSSEESLIIAEVQIGEYFGEDDIIRVEDKYGRIKLS